MRNAIMEKDPTAVKFIAPIIFISHLKDISNYVKMRISINPMQYTTEC
jgi:hypothetical protein